MPFSLRVTTTGESYAFAFTETATLPCPSPSRAAFAETDHGNERIYLDHDTLLKLAKRFPLPQEWYDEDFSGLF